MLDAPPPERPGWAYVSLLSALPGITVAPWVALALQVALFEGAAIALAAVYDAWSALALATVAIVVATAGSAIMLSLSGRIRKTAPPRAYRETLFHSGIDVVMGLVAFVALLTYVLVADGAPFHRVLGDPLPVLPVFLGLFIAWDVCYRIGTAWWVAITGLWRVTALDGPATARRHRDFLQVTLLTVVFALVQLLFVPALGADSTLALLVLGHVGAVLVVGGLTAGILVFRSAEG